MAESKKSTPAVTSFVTYVSPDSGEVPALVVKAHDEGVVDLFVFDGKIDPLQRDVPHSDKGEVKSWHR